LSCVSEATVRAIFFSDIHITHKRPRARIDDYYSACIEKLQQIGELARKKQADFVSVAGDIYHYKSPGDNTFQCTNDLIDIFKSYSCPVFTIAGNHDLLYDSYEYIDRQPYSTLVRSGAITDVTNRSVLLVDDDGYKVRIIGVPYDKLAVASSFAYKKINEDFSILLGHIGASPEGGNFFGTKLLSYQEIVDVSEADLFHFGHLHQQFGINQVANKWFISTGSITRGTSHIENIMKQPQVAYVEFGKDYFRPTLIRLQVRDANEIFDLTQLKKVEQETNFEFFKALEDAVLMEDPVEQILKSFNLTPEIQGLVNGYLNRGEADTKINF